VEVVLQRDRTSCDVYTVTALGQHTLLEGAVMTPETTNSSVHRQQTISSFFSKKRKTSPIDLTLTNDDSDELLPPVNRIKNRKIKHSSSSSLTHDPSLPEISYPRPSHLKLLTQSPSKGEGYLAINPLREKLKRRDMVEKERRVSPSRRFLGGNHRFSEENNHFSREKETSGRYHRKSTSAIGPAGLPCTPLEEAVSVAE
jgi:hypothetical protein